MLQLKNIVKTYVTGEVRHDALKGVSIGFRENEFVSILGQSGSGKTTMLNIIGGLDRYDSGELLINGVSTRKYKDSDWDYYRNNSIGFVFQSYNLIPHQSVLVNVELALTLAGVSKKERRQRAIDVLKKVGLEDHIYKKPNQMSGGQMQRVAIARALINNPDILLADEPTGALDSETSVQIMELLKEIAKDKLVIMVTHNPELAERYSTRIVKLLDGKIVSDSNPYDVSDVSAAPAKTRKISMSFLTALSLSFNNLRTKKGRTLLTSVAGSIGIIGIALIIALSTGMSTYISDIQKDTMASYPLTISSETIDLSSALGQRKQMISDRNADTDGEGDKRSSVYADYTDIESKEKMKSSVVENNLSEFKKYLDNPDSEIHQYLGENGIIYNYDINFSVYSYDTDGTLVNSDINTESILSDDNTNEGSTGGIGNKEGMMYTVLGGAEGNNNFSELMKGTNDEPVNRMVTDNYDVLYGSWPENYDEVVLVLNENNAISADTLYQLGLITTEQYRNVVEKIENGEAADEITFEYKDICEHTFYMIPECDQYIKNNDGTYTYTGDGSLGDEQLLENAVRLKIVGVVRPVEDAEYTTISTTVAYTSKLTDYVIEHTNESPLVGENIIEGISYDTPSSISIYADSFEDKEAIADCIADYNKTVDDDLKITYTDYVEVLTSSVTTIINGISYVLIAFVAVSLIVSCIMIGIITHISVMERTKEIGILRALGASKRNISQVFNAETFIIGCCAGLLGIGISLLLLFPINSIIERVSGISGIQAQIPLLSAVLLIVISIVITLLGGLLPAKKAAKKDPVIALRSE